MKVSHREVAELQRDPKSWARSRASAERGFFSLGYAKVLKLGIRRFEHDQDAAEARKHIQKILARNSTKLTNIARINDLLDRFERYIGWRRSSGLIVMGSAARVSLPLGLATLTGEVDRVEFCGEGYRGVLLGDHESDWRSELRMPLLQKALAVLYEKPQRQFSVGVQELDASGLEEIAYNSREIDRAAATFGELISLTGVR